MVLRIDFAAAGQEKAEVAETAKLRAEWRKVLDYQDVTWHDTVRMGRLCFGPGATQLGIEMTLAA